MLTNYGTLRQHSAEEWSEVRPVIERLYVKELRPLSTVIQILENEYQFHATVAMYKRVLRLWGVRKNNRSRARLPVATIHERQNGIAHYLTQNDVDEALHSLLDILNPWITQAGLPRYMNSRVYCPARAGYIYDPFTRNVAIAAAAFESDDAELGGTAIRRAFVDLEHTLTPELRSMFTLHSLLFSLAMLNLAGLFEISRLLIAHATRIVFARTRVDTPISRSSGVQRRLQVELGREGLRHAYDGRNISHPFPQIMNRLQALRLRSDDKTLTEAVLRAWSAYYQGVRMAVGMSFVTQCSQKEYWEAVFENKRCPGLTDSHETPWDETIQPTLHYLNKLADYAQKNVHDDIVHLTGDELLSLYSFNRHEEFEKKALERVESTNKDPIGWNVSLELVVHYQRKGDFESAIGYLRRLVPDGMDDAWEGVLWEVLRDRFGSK